MDQPLNGLTIGFVGAGAMAEAMVRGLLGTGASLLASDPDPARRAKLETECRVRVMADNRTLVAEAAVVVLAVKPQTAPGVLQEIGPAMHPGQIMLSIVAGLKMETIAASVPDGVKLMRAMPNAPALIGAGVTGLALAVPVEADERLARALLSTLGRVVAVPENLLDAVTGLSGSGPAYVALFAEAMIEAGVKVGLSRAVATELTVQTLFGTARLLAGGESPLALRERVTSPGGTTAHGLFALERGAVRAAVSEAVTAATERAAALGRTGKARGDER